MDRQKDLKQHLSSMEVWAFSIGTSVGWGSLVVTANTYLVQAGPFGSVLGLVAGALIMLIIGRCYSYMINLYPKAGGAYAFTREAFGYDHAFLAAWFLALTYFAVLWANATSLPLFGRIFLGGIFRFGKLYTIFGYDVFLGEALLSILALVLTALLCTRGGKLTGILMSGMAILFTVGILACFVSALPGFRGFHGPAYVPDSSSLSQIVHIAIISPWAFIGFESVSHAAEEYAFEKKRIHLILLISVISTLALYVTVTLLSVTAFPSRYDSWLAYIRDLDHLSGLEALPAFYAANHYLGSRGVLILMLSLLSLVITSLIGNISALSRLFYALGRDRILPESFCHVNDKGVPDYAVWATTGISILAAFIGRTAIGWIVDITTIGATMIYGFVAASTMKRAKEEGSRTLMWLGRVGLGFMLAFGAYIFIPNLLWRSSLARETYFLFIIWSVLGFLFFRSILHRKNERRFGSSLIVWVALLSLVLFVSLIWMRQSMILSNDRMQSRIDQYYMENSPSDPSADREYLQTQLQNLEVDNTRTIIIAVGMFSFALIIMLTNHSYMNRRAREHEIIANRDPMTGVKNKHAYILQEQKLNEAIKKKQVQDFAIVVCDVNGLKKINDTYGHKAGDEYIQAACKMVCEIFKHSPVFRIGGDEFVVVLTNRDFMIRRQLMTVLHDRSVEHINKGGAVVSGGISQYRPQEDHEAHEVFKRADELMYEEKKLLKGLGAVTRDDAEEEASLLPAMNGTSIINVRKKVLIVEDEIINQQILGTALEEGYELLYAMDGQEAIQQLHEHSEDLALVLLDLNMPKVSGMEVLKCMKQTPEFKNIPVVVVTADQSAEVECLKLGAMEFIPKPYPAWEIVQARVNKCIELSEDRDIIQSTERDHLTGLFNMDYFLRYVKIFDQHYWEMPMDAIVVDINHFHMINERYGKHFGDSILHRVGQSIRSLAREIGGVGCRQSADTFFLYCPHREDYSRMLDSICSALVDDNSDSSRIHLRMGVYPKVDKVMEIERRFDRAKLAESTVKGNYANAIGLYDDELHEAELFRERLLEDFQKSLQQGSFTVHYQPKFDIRPEKPILASAEALVRWVHPELGMISPAVFIPLLEENGLILDLDRFVWHEVGAQLRSWKDQYGFSVPVSVNVSRIDMLTPKLSSIFTEILEEFHLTAEDFVLEITESAYTGDSEQVIAAASQMRNMNGFHIEMDDFGTGYSSLGMLTHLPIDALKLDISFVRSAFGETRDVRMIELIIDIADYLHVPVVAEGVETEEQYLVLRAMGCDLVQGYYFSRPIPREEFSRFLEERLHQSIEVTPVAKKTCMSISKALSNDFESIFYIDTVTDYYLEFSLGENGSLEIHPCESSFFADAREKILAGVCEEDAERLEKALDKESLMMACRKDDSLRISYRRKDGDQLVSCCLQTIRTRSGDDGHIVIGVRPE